MTFVDGVVAAILIRRICSICTCLLSQSARSRGSKRSFAKSG